MKYMKGKISGYSIFMLIFMLILPFPCTLIWIFKILINFTFCIKDIFILIFPASLLLIILYFFKDIRYVIIGNDRLTYYSLLHPFGKRVYFDNYIGKIITTETGSIGSYKVVYLVDKQNRTRLKLMGLHYKNFDEMIEAIPLKKIGFSPSVGSYFKLLFTGKIKVDKENKNDRQKNKNAEQKIRRIIYIVVSIGLLCFVLGMIVKILSKL